MSKMLILLYVSDFRPVAITKLCYMYTVRMAYSTVATNDRERLNMDQLIRLQILEEVHFAA